MTRPSQDSLFFSHPPIYAELDFLPAECNQEAVTLFEIWPHWPSFAVALSGPSGCGKSHLVDIFCHRHEGKRLTFSDFCEFSDSEIRLYKGLAIETDETSLKLTDEKRLFHLFNDFKEQNKFLIFTSRIPPSRWSLTLPDLISRLNSIPLIHIGAPDDYLLQAVLIKLFSDRQLQIAPEVPAFVISRIERSFAALHRAVDLIDQISLSLKRPVTVHLVSSILKKNLSP
jgi:chromosomal replication initiation ATPase DnaA